MKKVEKIEKMIMTKKLADQLMDSLMCVAISATGGAIQDSNCHCNQEQMDFAQEYARQAFCDILEAWEDYTDKQWNITG